MSETSEKKIYNSTFQVKVSVIEHIFFQKSNQEAYYFSIEFGKEYFS